MWCDQYTHIVMPVLVYKSSYSLPIGECFFSPRSCLFLSNSHLSGVCFLGYMPDAGSLSQNQRTFFSEDGTRAFVFLTRHSSTGDLCLSLYLSHIAYFSHFIIVVFWSYIFSKICPWTTGTRFYPSLVTRWFPGQCSNPCCSL